MTILIDGKKLADELLLKLKDDLQKVQTNRAPGLATILVGDDPASKIYVNTKQKKANILGYKNFHYHLDKNVLEKDLSQIICHLNNNHNVDGILVQLPLPYHIDSEAIMELIDPKKDVDGIHPHNLGKLVLGRPEIIPCTPLGCLHMIRSLGVKIEGKHAVVVGRSNIVGKPMAQLLMNEEATVSICHKKTVDLPSITKQADILVVATGNPFLINDSHIKKGVIIIDVGINRLPNGKIVGDVDMDKVMGIASHLSPVPGGVGPMTIACLMQNTYINFMR